MKNNRCFAGICNSESVSDYNGGVWDYVNAVKGVASGGSNSSGVGDIDSGGGVMADSNGVEADGSDETRDAACEAVVRCIVVCSSNDADDCNACGNADDGDACDNADDGHVKMRMMEMNLTMQMVVLMAMDVLVPVGTALMAVVVLMTLLKKVRETPQWKV